MNRIGRYQVLEKVGQGGMAVAWLALAENGQRVVLKTPTSGDEESHVRLRDEARAGVRLDDPGLVQTLDLFEHEGRPVLVLAYIDGCALSALLQAGGLPLGAVARVGSAISGALRAIHTATDEQGRSLNMVHRDVSPGNILVDREGAARLIDLGIARSAEAVHKTKTGTLLGTLPYLAPELLDEAPYSPSTDLWALGCVLFEAAVGRRLFDGTEAQIVGKLFHAEAWDHPEWSRLPPALADGLRLLLDRDPTQRLDDAGRAAALFRGLEAEDPGGWRRLVERVAGAAGPPPSGRAEAPFAVPPTTRAYLADNELETVDPKQLSSTRRWSSHPEQVAPVFEALAPGQELSEPAPDLFGMDRPVPVVSESPTGRPAYQAPPGMERPGPKAGSLFDEELDLDRDERPRRTGRHLQEVDGMDNPYPEMHAKERSWGCLVAALVVVALVGGAGAWAAYRVDGFMDRLTSGEIAAALRELKGELAKERPRSRPEPKPPSVNPDLLPAGDRPDCFTTNDGWFFVYENEEGENVVKERIGEVPRAKRRLARCVQIAR